MNDLPPPPPERLPFAKYRDRLRRPGRRNAPNPVQPTQGDNMMNATTFRDDDQRDETIVLDAYHFRPLPRDLTIDEAAALWADLEANEAVPEHVKDAFGQRINQHLDEITGRTEPAPPATSPGIWFHGASPDVVERELRSFKKKGGAR